MEQHQVEELKKSILEDLMKICDVKVLDQGKWELKLPVLLNVGVGHLGKCEVSLFIGSTGKWEIRVPWEVYPELPSHPDAVYKIRYDLETPGDKMSALEAIEYRESLKERIEDFDYLLTVISGYKSSRKFAPDTIETMQRLKKDLEDTLKRLEDKLASVRI